MSEDGRRKTRYQAAIVRDDRILLIQHQVHSIGRSHWLLPGGGIDDGGGSRWLNLADDGAWDEPITSDAKTYPELVRIRQLLGYEVG